MKKLFLTALLAVFFSLLTAGCFTQLKRPEPQTGERYHYYDYDYYDNYYWGGYGYPAFFGYPYFNYGYFYSPWWYYPRYYGYYGNGDGDLRKSMRSRDHGFSPPPSQPSGIISPPPPPPPSSPGPEVKTRSGSGGNQNSGDSGKNTRDDNSGGKSTRGRR